MQSQPTDGREVLQKHISGCFACGRSEVVSIGWRMNSRNDFDWLGRISKVCANRGAATSSQSCLLPM